LTCKHFHQPVDSPRRRLEGVTIEAVALKVHEGIASSRQNGSQYAEALQNG
jgi:hypothetical protein